jgi:3-methyladenine DNA glycosylase AlkC
VTCSRGARGREQDRDRTAYGSGMTNCGPKRVGARRPTDVPEPVRKALALGAESANHMEQIALDMGALWANMFPGLEAHSPAFASEGFVGRMRTGGRLLWETTGIGAVRRGVTWESDTARGWAAMAVGAAPNLPLSQRLSLLRTFADDRHFAVREWAWLSLRPHVAEDVERAICELRPWVSETSPRLRRFACEVTRPRGVWSCHIAMLKARPELGSPLLRPLREDDQRYVQDSVANWLNDASKHDPDWVIATCKRWVRESNSPATARICRRASRSLHLPG